MPTSEVEVVVARLLDAFPEGIEELAAERCTELAVYTDAAGEAEFRAWFPGATSAVVAGGWEDSWKEFHHAVRAGGLWIGPPWIAPPPGEPAVVVDPGRAFGTGAHPTTRACIELLSTLERGSVLDAGCGSGVVAVAALRLGFAPVHAVDLDEIAVAVAAETARRNDVVLEPERGDVLRDELPLTDVLVANIELGVVERLLERSLARTAVTSGYLGAEAPAAAGWKRVERLELEDWAADVFARQH